MSVNPWRTGVDSEMNAPGLYDIYFIPQPEAHWRSDFIHVVYWNGFLISGPLEGYNAFRYFIDDWEEQSVPHIIFNEAQ